jgi:hypothetical protein
VFEELSASMLVEGTAMQSQYRLSALACRGTADLGKLFVECSSPPFGLACLPVSLQRSRHRPLLTVQNESTGFSESSRAIEHVRKALWSAQYWMARK